jgi:hypothetical protein
LLVSWYVGGRYGMPTATRIVAGEGDLVQRTEDGCTGQVLDDQTVESLGDAVCDLHHTCGDEEHRFLS